MSKFKVGDKVKIVKPWSMDSQYKNNIVTISKIVCDDDCFVKSRYEVEENDRPWFDMELEYVQNDVKIVSKFVKNKEKNEMRNEVLELWYDRETKKIGEKYDEIVNKKVKETYSVVESYNELIKNFNNDLEDLFKYDNANEQFVLKENNSCNVFKYVVDYDRLEETARKEIQEDFNKDSRELNDKYKEINALLSMSEDLEYQQSILIEYKIIDKKTKRMI